MMKKKWIAMGVLGALIGSGGVWADSFVTYFGEDLYPYGTVPVAGNAKTSYDQFVTQFSQVGIGVEDFESYSSIPSQIVFSGDNGDVVANFDGSQAYLQSYVGDTGVGFATSGTNFINLSSSSTAAINFLNPVAAFGFYGTDIGDIGSALSLRLTDINGTTHDRVVGNTIDGPSGTLLYYGFVDYSNQYTRVEFVNPTGGDVFGFDDFILANISSVTNAFAIRDRDGNVLYSDRYALPNQDLSGLNLVYVDFNNKNLSDGDLRLSNLTDGDLRNANLRGTDLRGANLTDVLFGATLFSSNTLMDTVASDLVLSDGSWLQVSGGKLTVTNGVTTTGNLVFDGGTLGLTTGDDVDVAGNVVLNENGGTIHVGDFVDVDGIGLAVFDESITGSTGTVGNLVLSGEGWLALTATNNFSGKTIVSGPSLSLEGALLGNESVEVLDGALGGNGFVGSDVFIQQDGAFAPGIVLPVQLPAGLSEDALASTMGIGAMQVDGAVHLGTGTEYTVLVDNAGNASRLDADSVSIESDVTISGRAKTPITHRQEYLFMTADSGIDGQFDVLDTAMLEFSIKQRDLMDTNLNLWGEYWLVAEANGLFFSDYAFNSNQGQIANVLDTGDTSSDPDAAALLAELQMLDASELPRAMQHLSGGINLDALKARTESFDAFAGASGTWMAALRQDARTAAMGVGRNIQLVSTDDRMAYEAASVLQPTEESKWHLTGDTFGDWGSQDGDSSVGAYGFDWNSYGFSVGADRRVGDNLVIGLKSGGIWTDVEGDDSSGNANGKTAVVELHASHFSGRFYTDASLAYGHGWNDTSRTVIGGRNPKGDYGSNQYRAAAECGYGFPLGRVLLEPYAGLTAAYARDEAYAETGGDAANLRFDAADYTQVKPALGGRLAVPFESFSIPAVLRLDAAWEHELADTAADADATFLGQSIVVRDGRAMRDAFRGGASVEMGVSDRASVALDYTGRINGDVNQQVVSASLKVFW